MIGNISFIIKDLQIHRPQLASTNRSYLQVNYIFLVFPSEIEPSLEDSNRRRLDNLISEEATATTLLKYYFNLQFSLSLSVCLPGFACGGQAGCGDMFCKHLQ